MTPGRAKRNEGVYLPETLEADETKRESVEIDSSNVAQDLLSPPVLVTSDSEYLEIRGYEHNGNVVDDDIQASE